MARIWRPDAEAIRKVLVRLTTHGPTFSYAPLFEIVHEMLVFGTSYEVYLEAVRRIKREDVRRNFLGLMPLIRDHFDGIRPSYVHKVVPRLYSLSRDIQIPFSPPLVYAADGDVIFPWLSFWKTSSLERELLSLFVTLVEEIIFQDSDLEDAQFQILDFSAPDSHSDRCLTLTSANKIPRVSSQRKAEMLGGFAGGYRLARSQLESTSGEEKVSIEPHLNDQIPLF